MTWTAAERETTITVSDADERVHIWTAQRHVITRLTRHRAFTLLREGDGWAEFTIPADQWNPATGAKRQGRALTPEQRAAAAEALARGRAVKVENRAR